MSDDDVAAVVKAAEQLPRRSRDKRWTHLSLCVLDAVFAMRARYTAATNVCYAYARIASLPHHLAPAPEVAAGDFAASERSVAELVSDISASGPDAFAVAVGNRQPTATRGRRVLKAEAARQYAQKLAEHGVERLADVPALLADPTGPRLDALESELRRVPGHGQGVRLAYFWMLAGDDTHVKADRMVLRWVGRVLGRRVKVPEATALVTEAAVRLGCTPWELDHSIWRAESGRNVTSPTVAE